MFPIIKTCSLRSIWNGSLLLILWFVISSYAIAAPWFTGPLLAPAGHTIPKKHANFEIYNFYTTVQGVYDNDGNIIHFHDNRNDSIFGIASQGLTDRLDAQVVFIYNFNHHMGANSSEYGDTTVGFGYQVLEQKKSRWRPDLRVTIQEILPTGRFDQLSVIKNGTDASGLGSYQTAINLNFQNVQQFWETHYLRTRLSLGYVKASNVHIQGLSAYGGTESTDGIANPGDTFSADLAAEYTLTQHWVAVMEANASKRNASRFVGYTGFEDLDDYNTIGHDVGKQVSLAPAIEYNFTSNIGIIGGAWFPVYGRSTAKFVSYVIALNVFW